MACLGVGVVATTPPPPHPPLLGVQIERTPLHHAAFNKTDDGAECCRILLDAGAQPNAVDCVCAARRWGVLGA